MSIDEKFLLIRNYDLFAHVTDDEYEEMNLVHNFIEAAKGQYIYFDSHYLNKLYFIKAGCIKIGYVDADGNEVIKEIIQRGEIFGQFTLEKNNLSGEFAQAYKTDVSLCAFTIEDFEKLLYKKPQLAVRFSKQVGQKLRSVENRLVMLLNKDVRTRLVNFLLQLVKDDIAENTPDGFCMPNYLTHEDIACLIGSSRQTVTTLINELAAQDMLFFNRQQICFLNVKELQKISTVA
jgi:CRP/FNR family transcriptional regulator, cyclic AMP receptor protein